MEKSLSILDRLFMAATFSEAGEHETALHILSQSEQGERNSVRLAKREATTVLTNKPIPNPL
ncbi:MAG: hypothetical protein G8345_08080 [Magnetococcales bacterium]|nr:hypothetical protein [Magnetococcales bacterium]